MRCLSSSSRYTRCPSHLPARCLSSSSRYTRCPSHLPARCLCMRCLSSRRRYMSCQRSSRSWATPTGATTVSPVVAMATRGGGITGSRATTGARRCAAGPPDIYRPCRVGTRLLPRPMGVPRHPPRPYLPSRRSPTRLLLPPTRRPPRRLTRRRLPPKRPPTRHPPRRLTRRWLPPKRPPTRRRHQ